MIFDTLRQLKMAIIMALITIDYFYRKGVMRWKNQMYEVDGVCSDLRFKQAYSTEHLKTSMLLVRVSEIETPPNAA
jgi:hypothetical protein